MAKRLIPAHMRYVDSNGDPLSGGKLYFYKRDTSDAKDTFSDEAATTKNTNPIVLDTQGRPSTGVWGIGDYKMVLTSATGTPASPIATYNPLVESPNTDDSVTSITALEAIDKDTLEDGILVRVAGNGPTDGIFYWDSVSNETPNGGTIVGTGPGQWLRLFNGPVHSDWFVSDKTGASEVTSELSAAASAAGGGHLIINKGSYLVANLGGLNVAGLIIEGESRFNTKLIVKSGTTGALFSNTNSASGTSAYCRVSSLMIDLNGQNVSAFDLGSVNNSVIEKCRVIGGSSFGTATGTGVRFHAPLASGSYSNSVTDCNFVYCAKGVFWDDGGNNNYVFGGECVSCTIGYDTEPASGTVDTPKIFGPRTEGCGIGLNEGASYGMYFGMRFESQSTADVNFTATSDHPQIFGGYTSASGTPLANISNADSAYIQSSDLGRWDIEASASRPRRVSGRMIYAAAGQTPEPHAQTNHSAYFNQYTLLKNNQFAEFSNNGDTNRIIGIGVDTSNTLIISGYNRATASYGTVDIGGGNYVRPITNGSTNCGDPARRWDTYYGTNSDNISSDGTIKQQVRSQTEKERLTALQIKGLLRAYKLNDAVERKGDDARIHFGVIAQDVEKAFKDNGLDAHQYGLFCYDEWDAEPAKFDEEGVELSPVLAAGNMYSIRYEELLVFIIAAI